ncbi:MAG: CpaD family pilus assembly lipoprotein [Alphaproteobacteria bacterium]
MIALCRPLAIAAVLIAGLAACVPLPVDYTESEWSKTLRVEPAPAHLVVGFSPGSSRILSGDLARLRAATATGGIVPSDRVVVVVAGPPRLAQARYDAVSAALLPYGIVPSPAPGLGVPADAAVIRRERYLVALPSCPDWSKPAAGASDFTNTLSSNFGCATAVNLGLTVAQPADLVEPRPVGLTDARPAVDAVNNYRLGKVQLPIAAQVGPIAAAAPVVPLPPAPAGPGTEGAGAPP